MIWPLRGYLPIIFHKFHKWLGMFVVHLCSIFSGPFHMTNEMMVNPDRLEPKVSQKYTRPGKYWSMMMNG